MDNTTALVIKTPGKLPWDAEIEDEVNIANSNDLIRLKHGLMANIPIVCRGIKCPYYPACLVDKTKIRAGKRCPTEVATLIMRFEDYCKSLLIEDNDTVDLSLVRELVDIEIQIMRASGYMAVNPSFVEDVVAGIAPNGTPYYKPELSMAVRYKETLRKERHRILTLLNSTRKDRVNTLKRIDPSTMAASLIAKAKALEKQGAIINADFTINEDVVVKFAPIEGEL